MDRRTVLAVTAGSLATTIGGCFGGEEFPNPADDPFPMDVENARRGGAETVVTKTVAAGSEYEDASMACANEARDAVRERLEDELTDLRNIGIGHGRGPEGFDGIAVTVHLTTATYDRDGELVAEADLEYEKLVALTPPTAYLQTAGGDRVCAVPVYVERSERHID